MNDSYYTSAYLSEILISHVSFKDPKTVVDFCVGGGDLLKAAENRWPDIKLYGTDISKEAVENLTTEYHRWKVEYCDFIDENSRLSCKILRKKKFDLILLNPPFTCKGSTIHKTVFDNKEFHCSKAMLFLLESIRYLKRNGHIYAILPISVAYSQKDSKIWSYLASKYNLTIIEERDKQYFKNCYPPNIIIVTLNNYDITLNKAITESINTEIEIVSIVRGQLSMNDLIIDNNSNKYVVHSTNLRNNKIENISKKVSNNNSSISGPGVLIHRVGKPIKSKICVIKKDEHYILSDCVILIKTINDAEAGKLKEYIDKNWDIFEKLYKGTGAKYITLNKLKIFLTPQNTR